MKNFHVNRYGQLVRCGAKLRPCPLKGKHITEEQKNFITDENYSKGVFNDEQMRLYLDNLNHKYNRKSFDAEEKRQIGATRMDYERFGRIKERRLDPFRLNVIYGSSIESNLAEDNDVVTEKEGYSYINDVEYKTFRDVYAGKYKPNKAASIELVKHYFSKKNHVTIPEGTVIRTTKPSDKDKNIVAPSDKTFNVLHVNSGSSGFNENPFKPVSVTWLGKNGWLYNVEVNQEILDMN